jgi:cytochrome b involved in lipid metabolism
VISSLWFLHPGKDADEMFEDIGHSSEARTKMKEYLIGTLQVAHLKRFE